MSSLALPSNQALVSLLGRAEKREAVEALILDRAIKHVAMDVAIGGAGFLPIPFMGLATIIAAIAAQAPIIYQPLARDIAEIYGRQPGSTERAEVFRGATAGGLQDVAVDVGVEFFREIGIEVLQDVGWGAAASVIPVLGGIASTAIDATIAWTMTWRVGLMLALYHENGGRWINSRKHTYELVRKQIKMQKNNGQARPTIRQVVANNKSVTNSQEASVNLIAQMLLDQGFSKEDVRKSLTARNIPAELVDAVLANL
jgi:uncharacterized protein (DUF697 family)